ncbi:9704_t:CDS:1, partial [Scutellospora calospora]
MTKEKWDHFSKEVEQLISNTATTKLGKKHGEDTYQLNKTWNKLSAAIIERAKKDIPNITKKINYSITKKYNYQATKIHKILTNIRSVLRHIETNILQIDKEWCNQKIIQINKSVKETILVIVNSELLTNIFQILLKEKSEITK